MDALHAFGSGGVLRLLLTQGGSSADRDVVVILRRLSSSLLRSGRHSPAACAPLTQLAMLLEDGASTAWALDVQRWQATLIRSLAAEAWQRWLRGLCAEPATSLPGRLHASELTRLVGKIAAGTSVAIGAVDARKAQLSGAAQALLRHRVPNSRAMAVSERAALRAVCAATLAAHSDTIPEDLREAFGAAIHDLLSHDQPAAGDVVSLLAHAVNGSSHSGLRQLWLVCFMPIVQLLAHGEEFAGGWWTLGPLTGAGCQPSALGGSMAQYAALRSVLGSAEGLLLCLSDNIGLTTSPQTCWPLEKPGLSWAWAASTSASLLRHVTPQLRYL